MIVRTEISVIIRVDTGRGIKDCLASLFGQDFHQPFHIIVMESGLEHECEAYLDQVINAHPNVFRFSCAPSTIESFGNLGLSHSIGKYVVFLTEMMVVKPDFLSSLWKMAKEEKSCVVLSDKKRKTYKGTEMFSRLIKGEMMTAYGGLFLREMIHKKRIQFEPSFHENQMVPLLAFSFLSSVNVSTVPTSVIKGLPNPSLLSVEVLSSIQKRMIEEGMDQPKVDKMMRKAMKLVKKREGGRKNG